MELVNWIAKCYSTYTGKTHTIMFKPNPLAPKPVFIKPVMPVKFIPPKVYNLSEFIANEAIKKAKKKTLLAMLEDEKAHVKKQIKWEDVVGLSIVGLGLWAVYTYSGYKVSFVPGQIRPN